MGLLGRQKIQMIGTITEYYVYSW